MVESGVKHDNPNPQFTNISKIVTKSEVWFTQVSGYSEFCLDRCNYIYTILYCINDLTVNVVFQH